MENEIDRKDLKAQALLERIGALTSQYENQVADLRVELTLVVNENTELTEKVKQLEEAYVQPKPSRDIK